MASPSPAGTLVVGWVQHHGRLESLARALDARAVVMPWAAQGQALHRTIGGWVRSAVVTAKTLRRPPHASLVLVQAPPVFAPLVALLAAPRHTAIAIDLHSGALNDPRWRWSFGLMRALIRRADALVVTNKALIEGHDLGATPVHVVHDFLVDRREGGMPPAGEPYVVFPASASADEPVGALAEAATLLAGEVRVVMTGHRKKGGAVEPVRTPGFLPEDQYRELLRGASAVLALTTREATMQQAAYEALELGVPLVCSSTRVLRNALEGAAVFVAPDGASIAAGIREALDRAEELRAGSATVMQRLQRETAESIADLVRVSRRAPAR